MSSAASFAASKGYVYAGSLLFMVTYFFKMLYRLGYLRELHRGKSPDVVWLGMWVHGPFVVLVSMVTT
jgi:hypothetical protein